MPCDVTSPRSSSPRDQTTALSHSSPTQIKSASKDRHIKSFAMEYLLAASENPSANPMGNSPPFRSNIPLSSVPKDSPSSRGTTGSSTPFGLTQQLSSHLTQLSQQLALPQIYNSCLLTGIPPPILPSLYGHPLPHYPLSPALMQSSLVNSLQSGMGHPHFLGMNSLPSNPGLSRGGGSAIDGLRNQVFRTGKEGTEGSFSPVSNSGDFANTSDSDVGMDHDKPGQLTLYGPNSNLPFMDIT